VKKNTGFTASQLICMDQRREESLASATMRTLDWSVCSLVTVVTILMLKLTVSHTTNLSNSKTP
jgi:hypothetical protein